MPQQVRVRPHRRAQKQFYVRGVAPSPTGIDTYARDDVITADSRDEARLKFREKHPTVRIVLLHERQ